jgi:cysteine-S-conjugate beta-lyase
MFRHGELDRRAFLKRAGITATLGVMSGRNGVAGQLPDSGPVSTDRRDDFDFDEIYDRLGTDSTKWDGAVASFGEGIEVGMGIADMDFRTAPCITRALADRLAHENWGYLRMPAEFTRAIAAWNSRRYGLDIDPRTITLTTGVHPALVSGLHAFVPPGSRVLMTTPIYNGFYGSLRFARAVPEESPMIVEDGRYRIDFDDFERRIGRCNVFLLCNPHNPTGNSWSEEDLLRLGRICLERRVVVFADEIWCDLIMEGGRYTPFASLPDREVVDNSITFKAASKSFNLPALKAAWFFSTSPDLLERIRSFSRVDVSTPGVVANLAAVTEGDEWLDRLVPYLDANHDFAEAFIRDNMPLVSQRKPESTYLAWLDVEQVIERIGAGRSGGAPGQEVQRWFAENARVFLTPGQGFGAGGESYMRMNVGTARPLLARALENMAEALARL